MDPNHFDLPAPAPGLVFPQAPQLYATSIMGALVGVIVLVLLVEAVRRRSLLPLLLLAGGAVCYLCEPIVDVLGLCWHPRPNQWVALHTFGPVPLWGLGIYIIFFGAMPYGLLRLAERGIPARAFWIGVAAFFVVDLLCELPLIRLGLYTYYGNPPFLFCGLPLYWLFINTPGPLITVALLLRARPYFAGWRLGLLPLLPMTTDVIGSTGAGWPIFSALNTPGASEALKWGAGALTIVIGLLVMEALGRAICVPATQAGRVRQGAAALLQGSPGTAG